MQIVQELRPDGRETSLAVLPDGSWPDTELVREVVAIHVERVDGALAGDGEARLGPDDAR